MAWTVNVSKAVVNNTKVVQLTYTDGSRWFTDTHDITTPATLIGMAANKLAWLKAQDDNAAAIVEGVIDPSLLQAAPAPTEDPQLTAWRAGWSKLQTLNRLVAAGIIAANNPQLVTLVQNLKDTFKVAYLDSIV